MDQSQKILILGGTNFMGKTLLDSLVYVKPNPIVVCINRGKVYWNNEAKQQHPEVLSFYCDRKQHTDTTSTVAFVSNHLKINQKNKWTSVIDFSAFRWRDVQSVTKAIKDIARQYIFISTDSIYNNSINKLKNPIREQQYDLEEQYQQLKASSKSKDSYGYNKMKCQIYLNRVKPLPFVCLRLPDVIGPYDNTERFWCTVKWIQQSNRYPIPLTAEQQQVKLSFVDSFSVASQIIKLIYMNNIPSNSYNLCSIQSLTLKQFLEIIANTINPSITINYRAQRNKNSNNFYPSVQCGNLSCEKAIRQIDWNPLPITQSIKSSVDFFINRANQYSTQRKEMEKEYKRKIIEKSH